MKTEESGLIRPYWNPRRRVYLIWALIVLVGFIATHFYQTKNINGVWAGLAALGLGYMLKKMPLRVLRLRRIYLVWLITISTGMVVSGAVFYIGWLNWLVGYLGVFWLFLMGAGHLANGLVDPPAKEYCTSGGLQILAGAACLAVPALLGIQYIVAALVGALAMIWLIVYR
ncbi:hypothetical protein KY386_01425 [Candidatus Parcubacteria bacterium]|nr:hypothetical protein [Candidatus Parcubacteria bacterium]